MQQPIFQEDLESRHLEGLPLENPSVVPGTKLGVLLLMDNILHDPKDPKLWELWYIPYNG